MIPATPGHAWWHSSVDGFLHQFPVDMAPDEHGIIDAACEQRVHAIRVVRQETGPYGPLGPYCPGCLKRSPGHHLADRLEQLAADLAAEHHKGEQ